MGSARINTARQRLSNVDINTHYEDIMKESARRRGDTYDPQTGVYKDYGRTKTDAHCGGTSCALRKMFPKSKLTEVTGTVKHKGRYDSHMWNINEKGAIIDASRDQFGDTKGVHIIKPNDKRYHSYVQSSPEPAFDLSGSSPQKKELAKQHIKRQKRRATRNVNKINEEEMDLSDSWVQKSARIQTARQRLADIFDVIEGGGKIKRTEYEDDEEILPRRKEGYGWEGTELMEPEDFLDKAQTIDPNVFRRMYYKKRPWNTGPKTNLGDVHSNFLTDDPKSEFYRGVSNFQWGETHQMDKLEDLEDREIFRGDELGDVEFYKRKIRRGDPIEVPELHHQRNKTIGHEGRHRARALLEEGEEYIPVKGVSVDDTYGGEFEYEGLEDLEGEPTSYQKEKPKFRPKYKSPIGLGKSARIQMARERLGAVGKIDWNNIIRKNKSHKQSLNEDMSHEAGFVSQDGKFFTAYPEHDDFIKDVLTKHGDKKLINKYLPKGKQLHEGDIYTPWLRDTGMIRTRFDIGPTIHTESEPTKQQIKTIGNFLKDNEIPSEEIVFEEGQGNFTGDVSIFTQPDLASTSGHESIRKRIQDRNAKLRQRIAGLGFRERILNWLKEQPRFKSFDPDSSFVGTVKYDQDNQSMQIELNGKKYDFCNVEERLFDSFSGAGSKGAFFNREIKSLHNCGAW